MSKPDPFEEWLTTELQQSAPYIDDDGFTDSVMTALPTPAPYNVWHNVILWVAGLIACAVVLWRVPVLGILFDALALADLATMVWGGFLVLLAASAAAVYCMRDGIL